MLENLYPKVFYTSGIFLCDRMDLSLIFTFPHFRLFLTLALIFDTYRSIQRYIYISSPRDFVSLILIVSLIVS